MNNLKKSIIFSLLFHILFLTFLILIHKKRQTVNTQIEFNITISKSDYNLTNISQEPKKKIINIKKHIKQNNRQILNQIKKTLLKKNNFHNKNFREIINSQKSDNLTNQFSNKKYEFNNNIRNQLAVNRFIKKELKKNYPLYFNKKNKSSFESNASLPILDFIPSETELKAMSVIFKKGESNQIDIYSRLDSSYRITPELLDKYLNNLYNKGLLYRKKISPENIFTFSVFLVQIPIEMNKINSNNVVYLYKPNIDKNKLFSYLQSKLFQLKECYKKDPKNKRKIKKQIKSLQRGINILANE